MPSRVTPRHPNGGSVEKSSQKFQPKFSADDGKYTIGPTGHLKSIRRRARRCGPTHVSFDVNDINE
jgi:hypothetical protein